MRAALAIVALAACGVDQPAPGTPPRAPLSTDTYFTFPTGPTPCNEPVIDACILELGFCADGTYQYKLGDVITPGTYTLDGSILLDPNSGFQFELPSDYSDDGNGNVLGPWAITNLENDPDVACAN